MIPGETILTGAKATCGSCRITPTLDVQSSAGGTRHYVGTRCECGPYSRESEYFKSKEHAEAALERWKEGDFVGART